MSERVSFSMVNGPDLVISARTHGFLTPDLNEDALAYRCDRGIFRASIADGMGGMQAGRLASQTAVQVFTEHQLWDDETTQDFAGRCVAAARQASAAVRRALGSQDGGCAFTGVALDSKQFVLAHAGDTRAYLYVNGKLSQLTVDHSLAALELRQGTWRGDEQALLESRRQLYRFVGDHAAERARYITDLTTNGYPATVPMKSGQTLVLVTDGLWSLIPFEEMVPLIATTGPSTIADRLVERALELELHDDVAALTIAVT